MLPSTNLSRPPTTGNYLTRKGPAKPTRPQSGSRVTELRQILHDMRERSSLVEASLCKMGLLNTQRFIYTLYCAATVLKGKPHKGKATPESKESKRLLDEVTICGLLNYTHLTLSISRCKSGTNKCAQHLLKILSQSPRSGCLHSAVTSTKRVVPPQQNP